MRSKVKMCFRSFFLMLSLRWCLVCERPHMNNPCCEYDWHGGKGIAMRFLNHLNQIVIVVWLVSASQACSQGPQRESSATSQKETFEALFSHFPLTAEAEFEVVNPAVPGADPSQGIPA